MQKGTVYFFTGLSGAGKTTLGGEFYHRLKTRNNATVLLDGDQTKPILEEEIVDYSTEGRLRGARRLFHMCKMLSDQGIDVVCCSISMYNEIRAWNRTNIENYCEIYVKVKMETLYSRDQKGLYSSGTPQVVGIDLPWDEPQTPDYTIENDGDRTPKEIIARLEAALWGI